MYDARGPIPSTQEWGRKQTPNFWFKEGKKNIEEIRPSNMDQRFTESNSKINYVCVLLKVGSGVEARRGYGWHETESYMQF